MQLRYSYRLDPSPSQRTALVRAFGCARVVFNDGLAARRAAFEAGEPYLPDAELSKRLTELKKTRSGHGSPKSRRSCCSRPSPT